MRQENAHLTTTCRFCRVDGGFLYIVERKKVYLSKITKARDGIAIAQPLSSGGINPALRHKNGRDE